jgi:hypothetical protein
VVWKASTLQLGLVALFVVAPTTAVAAVIGAAVMTNVIAVSAITRIVVILTGLGVVTGLMGGMNRRSQLRRAMEEPLQPCVTARWRLVLRNYRPTPVRALGSVVVAAGIVFFGFELPGALLFVYGVSGLGHLVSGALCWMPMLDRWQRATGRQMVSVRHDSGLRGHAASLTAAELEAIVSRGELGDHDRGWLVDLFASLHHGGWYDEAAALGDHLYARWGEPFDAYNTACCLARAGDEDLAVEYLGEALRGGFGRREMVTDPDLRRLLPRRDVIELFKATRPPEPSAAGVGAPPGDGLGDGLVQGSGFESEDLPGGR